MCVWGGKLEAYQLLQTSGKEAFLSKRSEQLGGQIQNAATGLRVRTWCFPPMAELQQLGRPRVGILKRKINQGRVGGQVPAVWLSLPCTASGFDIGGDCGLSSPASSQCQVACHPSEGPPWYSHFPPGTFCKFETPINSTCWKMMHILKITIRDVNYVQQDFMICGNVLSR